MANVQVVLMDDAYMIRVGDEESDPVPYGEAIDEEIAGQRYLAMCDVKPGTDEEIESVLPEWVYCVDSAVAGVEIVEEAGEADEDEAEAEG